MGMAAPHCIVFVNPKYANDVKQEQKVRKLKWFYNGDQKTVSVSIPPNANHCMIILRKKNPLLPDILLQLCGSALERFDSYKLKYLGVLLSCDLSWSLHVEFACQKARRILGLLYRRFYSQSSQDSLK